MVALIVVTLNLFLFVVIPSFVLHVVPSIAMIVLLPCPLNSLSVFIVIASLPLMKNSDTFFLNTVLF